MIHGKNRRPIRAQNSGSHGSMGPFTIPNQLTRGPRTWNIDNRTCGMPQEQHGGGWEHLVVGRPSGPRRHRPPTFGGSFLPASISHFKVLGLLQLGTGLPICTLYIY